MSKFVLCKYLGLFLRSDLNWVDQVNYVVQKAWKALQFAMRFVKKKEKKSLAYTSLVRPVLQYVAACWDPCRKGHLIALDRLQSKSAQITNHSKDSDWETLVQRRTIAQLYALFTAYSGERAWKAIREDCEGLTI